MAFTNFYLIAGGAGSSDINAGSSIGAAQVTTTNGNWNAATGVFENQSYTNKQNIGAVGLTKAQASAGPTAFIYGG